MVARKKTAEASKKQAVVLIHGMGEPIPMQNLRSFVDAAWVTDESLISRNRPDSNDGQPRVDNPVWDKPDRHNRSFELRRITTEQADDGRRTDFYEFYWADMMHGTTWEHFKAWIADLLLRSPKRVPGDVFSAWIGLWVITLIVIAVGLYALLPIADVRSCYAGDCDASCRSSFMCWRLVWPVLAAIGSVAVGAFVNVVLLKYFGDVARYVKASPVNVARRQEIREKGVELLETLMGVNGGEPPPENSDGDYPEWDTEYDRIVVVGHSLGAVIGYDILKHSFARINRYLNKGRSNRKKQPYRHQLETLIQDAVENSGSLDIDEFRRLQNLSWGEMKEQGSPWLVSDFVTLGSPLTHSEFLLAADEADLREQQEKRILPTCPPTLEWDQKTKHQHFSYRPRGSNSASGESFRYPHHAAHFAFTRWTNIYSAAHTIFWGDLISGPVSALYGLSTPVARLQGIKEIAVLPEKDQDGNAKGRVPFFTHTKYWNMHVRTGANDSWAVPYHIHQLRAAMNLVGR